MRTNNISNSKCQQIYFLSFCQKKKKKKKRTEYAIQLSETVDHIALLVLQIKRKSVHDEGY